MTTITLTLRDSRTGETGKLDWDPDHGSVSGFRAEDIASYGEVPWSHVGAGIGDGRPALRSNNGMLAMLLMIGFDAPPELRVEVVHVDTLPPGSIY